MTMKTLSRIFWALVGIAIVGGAIYWLSGGMKDRVPPGVVEAGKTTVPPDATLAAVEESSDPVVEWTSGAVASERRTVVASRILARINAIRVRAGDSVAAGDLLVELDDRDYKTRVAQAREAIQAAQARLDLATSEKDRYEKLFQRGVATKQRLDQAVAEYQSASADLDRIEQSLNEAETALSYTRISAPVSGLVVERLAEPGETASPGTPILRLYDPTALRVEVPVRESLAVKLHTGDSLDLQIPSVARHLDGRIAEIVPFAEPGARTLLVKVALPPDENIYAGLFAQAAIPAGTRTRLLVPRAAIDRIGQLDFATVVDSAGVPERRPVTLGDYRTDGQAEVLSGLAAGERVLVGGSVQD
jgi:membrane fusion protein (multidrug efflux system)